MFNIFVTKLKAKKCWLFSPVSAFCPHMHVISAGKTALFGWTVGWSPVTASLLLIKYYNISLVLNVSHLKIYHKLSANSDNRCLKICTKRARSATTDTMSPHKSTNSLIAKCQPFLMA